MRVGLRLPEEDQKPGENCIDRVLEHCCSARRSSRLGSGTLVRRAKISPSTFKAKASQFCLATPPKLGGNIQKSGDTFAMEGRRVIRNPYHARKETNITMIVTSDEGRHDDCLDGCVKGRPAECSRTESRS